MKKKTSENSKNSHKSGFWLVNSTLLVLGAASATIKVVL
jgi:hypothetical protein